MVRRYNASTGAAPFDSLLVADVGDVNVNLYNLPDSCRRIRESYQKIVASGCVPLTLGKGPVGAPSSVLIPSSPAMIWSEHINKCSINTGGKKITGKQMQGVLRASCNMQCPLPCPVAGGDHSITYPILQAVAEK